MNNINVFEQKGIITRIRRCCCFFISFTVIIVSVILTFDDEKCPELFYSEVCECVYLCVSMCNLEVAGNNKFMSLTHSSGGSLVILNNP